MTLWKESGKYIKNPNLNISLDLSPSLLPIHKCIYSVERHKMDYPSICGYPDRKYSVNLVRK